MGLRIGVNALYLLPGKVGGTEIYLRSILKALAAIDKTNQYFIYHNRETRADLTPHAPGFVDRPLGVSGENRPARILFEQFVFPARLRQDKIDLLFNAGFTAPLVWPGPMVTVFHDLQYRRHPEYFRWFDLPFWRMLLPASAARSVRIVVPSRAVKADIDHYYRFASSHTEVIPHAADDEFRAIALHREERRFILTVSTLHPHKNLTGLLRAFQIFSKLHPGWKLLVVGLKGFDADRIEALQKELGLEQSVEIKGWIPREDLLELFRTANAFVYPSRFEGFGIPVLEAMAAGLPVACSRIPSLVEIAGDAVRFFDPDNLQEMAAAMAEITGDPETGKRLLAAGIAQAAQFSWEKSARRLLAVFEEAA